MDAKLRSTVSRIQQDRGKGNHQRALTRLADAVKTHPDVLELYDEAIDACIEAGESLSAVEYLKRAFTRFPAEHDNLLAMARERASARGDAVVGKLLIEHSVKRRDLRGALTTSEAFPDRTVRDLVQRARMKRSTLASAARGGHAVSDELVTNMMSEAVMNARLGRADEAASVVTEILDSTAGDAAVVGALEAFLGGLGEASSRSAAILFARARCALLSSRQVDAAQTLETAVAIDPALGADALDLLRDAGDQFDETPAAIENAVIEILLITGAHDRAAELLRPRFEAHPTDTAARVMEQVGRHLRATGDVSPLHVLFLDAAVEADCMDRVFENIEGLARSGDNRARLLEWLGDPARARFLSAPVMTLHAELAVEDNDFPGAARILRALCAYSSDAVPGVLAVLERHRSRDAALEDLFVELSARSPSPTEDASEPTAPGGANDVELAAGPAALGLEQFESREFRFTSGGDSDHKDIVAEGEKPPALGGRTDAALGDFDIYDGTNILGAHGADSSAAAPGPIASGGAGGRRPLDTGKAGIIWDEEGDDDPIPPPAARAHATPINITEEHVRNVAGALYASGARSFFYIEDDASSPPPEDTPSSPAERAPLPPVAPAPAPAVIVAGPPADTGDDAAQAVEAEPEPGTAEDEPSVPPSFDERFDRFQEGGLDDDDVVELMEEAVGRHDVDALERLFARAPHDGGHDARRGLCEVELQLMRARPGAGLDTLKRLRGADLDEEQRKSIWVKTVECQRMQRDYDAAHLTLVQLVKLYPDCPEVDRLAKQNYKEYLENHCTDAPVLEKVTSLDDDS